MSGELTLIGLTWLALCCKQEIYKDRKKFSKSVFEVNKEQLILVFFKNVILQGCKIWNVIYINMFQHF